MPNGKITDTIRIQSYAGKFKLYTEQDSSAAMSISLDIEEATRLRDWLLFHIPIRLSELIARPPAS